MLSAIDEFPRESAWISFFGPRDHDEGGKYVPENEVVEVYRDGSPTSPGRAVEAAEQSPTPLLELNWLAHELGHHESATVGLAPPVGDDTPSPLRYEEEVRAWNIGRRILSELAFVDWPEFERVKANGLAGYRDGLDISSDEALAAEFAGALEVELGGTWTERVEVFDELYWELTTASGGLTLHLQHYLGISLYPTGGADAGAKSLSLLDQGHAILSARVPL